MRSSEFPQYGWQPLVRVVDSNTTRWTPGRKYGQPSVIFMHTTEGSEGLTSAENGAAYDARRTDGTSCHFFVDQDSTIQEVYTTDEAHAARAHGNDVGIHVEVCGRAGQSSAQWADAASAGAIEQAARVCVAIRKKYGKSRFPLVNLTPAQLRAGAHGFAEHRDATLAWPEDGGTHTDPGPYFPWSKLFARIRAIELVGVAKLETIQIEGSWPLVGEGDDDAEHEGYDNIRRIQRQVGVKDDGVWGPITTEAVGVKRMTEDRYRTLFGFTRV